ncbi:unnamed protein product [Effrenium voratum]|uniref:Uncharacterized protein n=1 Tax=Effrenium voratum TaxID=2562239 RepID=A0AA36JN43_9DINO|nr:unnamed protein product [Effrenium voratum]CAJ1427601.1 unnamed protein product [Effrenium voratum]
MLPVQVRQKQSFRKVDTREPVVLSLAASGDLERLGSSFANHQRFLGPRGPEEPLVPYSERSVEEREALRSPSAPSLALAKPFAYSRSCPPSREQRKARMVMSFSSPLHGVESQRTSQFADFLRSKGTLPSESRRELQGTKSAAELFAEPKMSLLRTAPDRASSMLPSWSDRKTQTQMVWVGMERERWDQRR